MTSAAEAKTTQFYNNIKSAIPIHRTLTKMIHNQYGPTPLKADNKTPEGFIKFTIPKNHSKSWDMKFHRMKDFIKDRPIWVY